MSAKMGRPKKSNPINIRTSVRLDAETDKQLIGYCERHGITKGEAIRKGVMRLLENERYEGKTFTIKREPQPEPEPEPIIVHVEVKQDSNSSDDEK